eukprot:PhF_6_TR29458/c0_g1_i1/m.43650
MDATAVLQSPFILMITFFIIVFTFLKFFSQPKKQQQHHNNNNRNHHKKRHVHEDVHGEWEKAKTLSIPESQSSNSKIDTVVRCLSPDFRGERIPGIDHDSVNDMAKKMASLEALLQETSSERDELIQRLH